MTYSPKMSAMRQQLPQRPGQTPPDAERPFIYPPYTHTRTQPPVERHPPYPIPQTPGGLAYGHLSHPPPPQMHERQYHQGSHDMAQRVYGGPSGYPESNGHSHGHGMDHGHHHGPSDDKRNSNGEGGDKEPKKKRPQDLSLQGQNGSSSAAARRQSTSKQGKPDSATSESKTAPSVLVREKKQKACSNCRRAKLKCIVNDGESECVRCKSRIERCVFFPRTHDEDWQQTITHDVYSALTQLQSVSLAMRHMVNHLVTHNMMPPLPPMEFPQGMPLYEVPDRDMTVLQGWNAEKGKGESATKNKRKNRQEEEEEEDEEYRFEVSKRMTNPPPMPPHPQMSTDRLPPMGWAHVSPDHNQAAMHQLPPYIAPGHPGQVQLTPTSELDIPRRMDMDTGRPGPSFPYPPLAPSPSAMMSTPMYPGPLPQFPGQAVIHSSPSVHNATPNSLVSSHHHISPPLLSGGLPQSAPPVPMSQDLGDEVDVDALIPPAPLQPPPTHDSDGNPIIGSADGRKNLIKDGYISNLEATSLVQHFYTNLAPFMFGYQLELGRFPFLQEGIITLTPFILGVMCVLSSERVPQFSSHVANFKAYVVELLHRSPAESWQNLALSKAEQNTDETIDKLDPELGIGPEEIVGACILAAYMRTDDLQEMSAIAEAAFTWARGWIKLLSGEPRWSFAENLGIVPQERKANLLDMCRVWLLCYVVQGTQQLGASTNRRSVVPPDGHDPTFYCEQLLQPDEPNDGVSPYDVVLVYRAKLVDILKSWYRKSANLWNRGPNASFDLKRLATVTNAQLDIWHDESTRHANMPSGLARQLATFYDFARVLINSHTVRKMDSNDPASEATRALCLSKAIAAGLDFVEQCLEWSPRDFASMPTYDLNLIMVTTRFLMDAACPGRGFDTETNGGERPLTPGRIRSLLHMLADKFHKRHNEISGFAYDRTAEVVQGVADEIEVECGK